MQYRTEITGTFRKEFKRLNKRYPSLLQDIKGLREELMQNPLLGTDLGGGFRKIRMRITSKGKGKSGGARVITFTVIAAVDETEINLLYIYDKADCSSISMSEMEELRRANGL